MIHQAKKSITWLLIAAMLLATSLPGMALAYENPGAEQTQVGEDNTSSTSSNPDDGTAAGSETEEKNEPNNSEQPPEETEEEEEPGESSEEGNTSKPEETDSEESTSGEPEPNAENPEEETPEPENVPELLMLDAMNTAEDTIEVASWTALETAIADAPTGELTVITITEDFEATSLITIPAGKQIKIQRIIEEDEEDEVPDTLIWTDAKRTGIGFSLTGTGIELEFLGIQLKGTVGVIVAANAQADITGLKISNYEITDGTRDTAHAVYIDEHAVVTFSNCVFSDNIASDIAAFPSTSSNIKSSKCEIVVRDSTFTNTYISALRCNSINSLVLEGVTVTGFDDTISTGSSVSVSSSSNIGTTLSVTNSTFTNITANTSAVAINAYNIGAVTLNYVDFIGNTSTATATVTGGAYYQRSGTLSMTNCRFVDNTILNNNQAYGGGVYLIHLDDGEITGCTFENNLARFGGALYGGSSSNYTLKNVEFLNNSANGHYGGAIAHQGGTATLSDNVVFRNNEAYLGGAISAGGKIIIDGSYEDSILFEANKAYMGGAIACRTGGANIEVRGGLTMRKNEATSQGGGWMIQYGTATVTSEKVPNKIADNKVTGTSSSAAGGGIAIISISPTVTLGGDLEISGNTARAGAGIYTQYNHKFSIESGVIIKNNIAEEDGGGLKAWNSTTNVANAEIINNKAGTNGGGLSINDGVVTLKDSSIADNAAGNYGGGVYINGNGTSTLDSQLTNLTLDNNTALNGGGLAVYGSSRVQADTLTFTNNTAENNGGGVSVSRGSLAGSSITNTFFEDNTARSYVNVLSLSDYNEYGDMVGTIIKGVTGSSLPTGVTMHYLDPAKGMQTLTDSPFRAYNNFDFAYHEVIYQLKYNLHNDPDDADITNDILDPNYYGAGVRLTTSPGANKILIYLTGDTVEPPAGMEFAGWSQSLTGSLLTPENGNYYISLASLETNASDTTGAGIINLHARYNLKKLTVTFDANGGKFEPDNSNTLETIVEYGNEVDDPSDSLIYPDELYFTGWYDAETDGNLADLSYITKDTKVYAHWLDFNSDSQFEVIYYLDEDEEDVYYRSFHDFDSAVVDYPVPARRGYEFSYWYIYNEQDQQEKFDFETPVSNPNDGSIVTFRLYADWDQGNYTLIIKNSDNSDVNIEVEGKPISPGGDKQYPVNVDTITRIIFPEGTHMEDYDYTPTNPLPFIHFRPTENEDGYELYNIGTNKIEVTLTARLDQHSVSFFSDNTDDIPLANYLVKHRKTIKDSGYEVPSYGKPGYQFVGWTDTSDPDNILLSDDVETLEVTAPVTYIGVYIRAYTVNLVANNDSVTMNIDQLVITEDNPITLPALDNTETDAFLGWAWSETAETPDFTAGTYDFASIFPDADQTYITLYGVWEENSSGGDTGGGGSSSGGNTARLTVEYRDENGGLIDSVVTTHRVGSRITVTAPTLAGYILNDESSKTITIASGNANLVTFTYAVSINEQEYPSLERDRRIPYIEGYPDGTVRPDANLTRGEIATALFRLVTNADKNQPREQAYSDVPTAMWYHQPVAFLSGYEVLTGYPDGTFRPESQITRAEFTAVLSRFGGMQSEEVRFTDVPASHWAMEYISNASAQGWITGYPDGTFRPESYITRAEAITMINRMLERTPSENDFSASDISYSDLTTAYWAWLDILEATIGGLE